MSSFIEQTLHNKILWVSIFAWFIAQILKIIINYARLNIINWKLMISSGGMPSSHSAIVTSMATAIGYVQGFNSSMFAMGTIISLVVMYDAAGVRRAAGKQAEVLNVLISKLGDPDLPIETKLKELIGHSPLQVLAGALLGILIAVLAKNLMII